MIEEILKDSDYKLDLFSKKAIAELETKIIAKTNKNNQIIYYTILIALSAIKKLNLRQKKLCASFISISF